MRISVGDLILLVGDRISCGARTLGAVFGLALAAAGLATPTVAQTGLEAPPAYQTVDRFGVDLVSGSLQVSSPTIAVGDPAQGGLAFTATWDSTAWAWRYSNWGEITWELAKPDPNCLVFYTVVYMGSSNVFQREECGSNNFDRLDGLGTLVETTTGFTYTAADGSVAIYDGKTRGRPIKSITRLNGEVITYDYTGGPLRSVSNNYGYQLHFDYGSVMKVTALNNAVDACAPSAATCTYSTTWPSLTFTTVGVERRVTDALNRTTRIIFDGTTPITSKIVGVARPTTATGSSVTYVNTFVQSRGNVVTSATDGAGTWTYGYESYCLVPPPTCTRPDTAYDLDTTVTDPNGHATVYNIQWEGRYVWNPSLSQELMLLPSLRSIKNPLNETTVVIQSGVGLRRVTYPQGNEVTIARNGQGDVTGITSTPKAGSGLTATISTVVYPDCATAPILCHRPSSMTNTRGGVTNYAYDVAGNLLSATSPPPTTGAVRPQTRYVWQQRYAWYKRNGASTITQAATPVWVQVEVSACAALASCDATANEVLTTTTYQAGSAGAASNLLPLTVTSGSGNGTLTATATTTYDGVGNVLTVNGPLAGTTDTTRYVWDVMRQQVGVIGPDPDGAGARLYPATRTTYNADGQVTTVEQGATAGQTNANWTAFSALQTATTAYNAQGRKIRDTAASGTTAAMVTQYSYDSAGRLTCTARRMNPAVFGSLPASACALGAEGTFGKDRIAFNAYDNADRLLSTTNGYLSGVTMTESQTWTTNGQVATRTDGKGNLSTYVYDGFDRISRLRFPNASGGGSSTTDYENWTYDAANNVTAFRNRGGQTIAATWDALNRKTLADAPTGTADVSYIYDNLGRQLTATGAQTLTSTWDALSRMTSATGPLGTVGYQYDLAGRRTRVTWPGTPAFYVQYDYNLDNGVSAIRENGAASGAGVLATYAYDNLGRRTGITRGNTVPTSYSYDAASRLTGLTHNPAGTAQDVTFGFSFNPVSQILSRTSTNAIYAYTPTIGATAYANNGRNQVTTAGGTAITYDTRWNITGTGTATYAYNALNQLITATVGGTATSLTYDPADRLYQLATTRFLYDGPRAIAEYNTSNVLQRRFVPGPGTDEVVAAYEGSGLTDRSWPLQDERGSVIASTSGTGAASGVNTYDEYGRPAVGNTGRFQYTGQMWLSQAAVYHYKARAYQPDLGRFLQTDPVGYDAGLNLYAYVGNDPVNATDPTGLCYRSGCWLDLLRRRQDGAPAMSSGELLGFLVQGAQFSPLESTTYIVAKMAATVAFGGEVNLGIYVHEKGASIVGTGWFWGAAINLGFDTTLLGGGVVQVVGPPQDKVFQLDWSAGLGALDVQGGAGGLEGVGVSADPSPFPYSGTVGFSIQRHSPHSTPMNREQVDAEKAKVGLSANGSCGRGVPCLSRF